MCLAVLLPRDREGRVNNGRATIRMPTSSRLGFEIVYVGILASGTAGMVEHWRF
jgi:hypothetical protein